jgi:hypothetical protein
MTEPTHICPDCGTCEGQPHELFCFQERCPFCRQQLISCGCIVSILGLNDEDRKIVEEYLDDSVEPLRGIIERWRAVLDHEGRIPYRGGR